MNYKNSSYSKDSDIISSSEIGQFNYCLIAWYLKKCGYEPKSKNIIIGKNKHIKIGKLIDKTQLNIKKYRFIAALGYLLLFFGILIFIIGVFLFEIKSLSHITVVYGSESSPRFLGSIFIVPLFKGTKWGVYPLKSLIITLMRA